MTYDDEAERAVARWVRIGDEVVAGKMGGERASPLRGCTACGTRFRVLASDDRALCARCFLEDGASRTSAS